MSGLSVSSLALLNVASTASTLCETFPARVRKRFHTSLCDTVGAVDGDGRWLVSVTILRNSQK